MKIQHGIVGDQNETSKDGKLAMFSDPNVIQPSVIYLCNCYLPFFFFFGTDYFSV
jgi:hypothetical protein